MKKLVLFALLILPMVSSGQVSSYFHGDAKVFEELKKRTLIVELLDEDEKIVKKYSKPKFANDLQGYRDMIKNYNNEIQLYAKKYWNLNAAIEFKTMAEVAELKKSKSKSYAILRNLRMNDIDIDFGSKSSLYLNVLAFTRIETNYDKADSQVYMPIGKYQDKYLQECDYKYAFGILASNIEYIISKKKNINSEKFVKLMAEGNCNEIPAKTLVVRKALIYEKSTEKECIKAYGNKVQFVSDEEFNSVFVNGDESKVCLFSVPWEIGKGGMGPVSQSFLMSFKTVLDSKSGKVLYQFLPTGFAAMGQNISYFIIPKDMENIVKCK